MLERCVQNTNAATSRLTPKTGDRIPRATAIAAGRAAAPLGGMARREPGLRGMGTTLSAAGIIGDRLVVATVGDSRVYVQRNGALVLQKANLLEGRRATS